MFQKPLSETTDYRKALTVFAATTTLLSLTLLSLNSISHKNNNNNFKSLSSTHSSSLLFTLVRKNYSPLPYFNNNDDSNFAYYEFLSKHKAVIEPSVDMGLSIDLTDIDSSSELKFSFTVCSQNDKTDCQSGIYDVTTTTTSYVNFACTPHAVYDITVNKLVTGRLAGSSSGSAVCLYVRREIRSLSAEDLSEFADTSHVLWEYTEDSGREKYGDSFHSNSFLLQFHQFNAAQRDADHIHDGVGFLIQHVKFTNIFESSLQAVNSAVALPYWDFTIDQAAGNIKPYQTFVFTSDLYGSIALPKDYSRGFVYENDLVTDASIQDGRWKGLKAEFNDKFESLRFGYGYMRAPWSMNPSPYISRYTKSTTSELPSCGNHYDLLSTYGSKMVDFFYKSSFGAHATVHGLIGSMYGCDVLDPFVSKGFILNQLSADRVCSSLPFLVKEFYRKGYLTPNKNCELNESDFTSSVCGFTCDAEKSQDMAMQVIKHYSDEMDSSKDGIVSAIQSFLCEGDGYKIYPGDHIESASPADPSFWVIHPTLERLLHARLMVGGFDDESWSSDAKNDYVCSGNLCKKDDDSAIDYYDTCCDGHFEHSQLLDAVSGDRYSYYGPTNREVLDATDPRSSDYNMPYIYDKFKWDHCSSYKKGKYDIETYLNDLSATRRKK